MCSLEFAARGGRRGSRRENSALSRPRMRLRLRHFDNLEAMGRASKPAHVAGESTEDRRRERARFVQEAGGLAGKPARSEVMTRRPIRRQ